MKVNSNTVRFSISAKALALALFLCVIMSSIIVVRPALADGGGSCGENAMWTLSGGTLTISGSGSMTDFNDDNMPPWYDQKDSITKVVIKDGITNIGTVSFFQCSKLSKVLIGKKVTSIGARAFRECTSLSSIYFPDSVETIGEAAFEGCEALNGVVLSSGLRRIDDYAFYGCKSLSSITIPSNVTYLGMVAFAYCTNLRQVIVNCDMTKLPDWTFYGCTNLSTVSLPTNVSLIGDSAFHECSNLTTVYCNAENVSEIQSQIDSDATTGTATVVSGAVGERSNVFESNESGKTSRTQINSGENSQVIVNTDTKYSYFVDGKTVTQDEYIKYLNDQGVSAGDDAENAPAVPENAKVEQKTTITIDASVKGDNGWDELSTNVKEVERNSNDNQTSPIKVNVQIDDSTITSENLKKIAGQNAQFIITSSEGDVWKVDGNVVKKTDFSEETYDLGINVEKQESNNTDIKTDDVYKINFNDDVNFKATFAVDLGTANTYSYASLYEKVGGEYKLLQTTVVDRNGNAWFSVDGVAEGTDYYVGMNVEDVSREDAIIPEDLYQEYGLDDYEEGYLYDAEGNKYVVGEATSSWGITGGQFAIYIGVGVGALVIIVAIVMIFINKSSKSKAKYAAMKQRDEKRAREAARRAVERAEETGEKPDTRYEELGIDEEELKLKVMQEMLDEMKQNKG